MKKVIILLLGILFIACISSCDIEVDVKPNIHWDVVCLDCHVGGDLQGNQNGCTGCHPLNTLSIENHGDYFTGFPPVTP
jgi:hypothetical protein